MDAPLTCLIHNITESQNSLRFITILSNQRSYVLCVHIMCEVWEKELNTLTDKCCDLVGGSRACKAIFASADLPTQPSAHPSCNFNLQLFPQASFSENICHSLLRDTFILKHCKSTKQTWRYNIELWSNVWRVSSLKSHSLCQNSKVAMSQWVSDPPRSGIELPGQLKKNLWFFSTHFHFF